MYDITMSSVLLGLKYFKHAPPRVSLEFKCFSFFFFIESKPLKVYSKNFPSKAITTITASDNLGIKMNQVEQFTAIEPGLTGEVGTVSFRSVLRPCHFWRVVGSLLYLKSYTDAVNTTAFSKDATFRLHRDKWFSG